MFEDTEGTFALDTDCELLDWDKMRFKDDAYDRYRPTVSCILVNQGEVLLVQSSKGESRCGSWHPPQGGVPRGLTLYQGLAIELGEELGQQIPADTLERLHHESTNFKVLGAYVNTIRGDEPPKYIVCVTLWLNGCRVELNEENKSHVFVGDQYKLWHVMTHTRPVKLLGTCHAIERANKLGMLGWSCEDVIALFLAGREMVAA